MSSFKNADDIRTKYVGDFIMESNFLVVLTGAGVSAESGIPTFRGPDGLWKKYSPHQLANYEAFLENPKLVWEWYGWRREKIKSAEPNPAHISIAKLERIKEKFYLITQNIDGLHKRAGSQKVIEFHGNIWKEKCISCNFKRESYEIYKDELPKCPNCGNLLRPDVVWFGEPINHDILQMSFDLVEEADCVLVVGTSAVVYPFAGLIEFSIKSQKKVIEVNLEPTPFSDLCYISLQGKAGEILPQILNYIVQ
jgi:NAD-dependent deacetylase